MHPPPPPPPEKKNQLLLSEPGNGPLLGAFDRPVGPRGYVKSKHCIIPKECFGVTSKFCFILDPQIPNFYFANLDTDPFFGLVISRSASGLRLIKKLNKTKISKN